MHPSKTLISILAVALPCFLISAAEADTKNKKVTDALDALRAVGPKGEGHAAAKEAWPIVAAQPVTSLPTVLAAMDDARLLATNYLRAAVDTIAERELKKTGKLPDDLLEAFLLDTKHSPAPRRLAYEWLVRIQPEATDRLMPKMLDDPSLELRRDAVQRVIDEAKDAQDNAAKLAAYRRALAAVRDLDQLETITKAMKDLGETVNTASHLGFVLEWHLAGPFDNTNKKGFDVAYPPEKKVDLAAKYDGKNGKVGWEKKATADAYGLVDLNELLDKHKGAVAYAAAVVKSPQARKVQIRMGCINANKVWVNGKQVTANEVYHANTSVDQYIADAELQAGNNVILVKVCQNEQEESWAQRWQFQLRVTDALGGAVLAAN